MDGSFLPLLRTGLAAAAALDTLRGRGWRAEPLARHAYRGGVVAKIFYDFLAVPRVYTAIGHRTGIPNSARLLIDLLAVAGMWRSQPWLHWFTPLPHQAARGAQHRHAANTLPILDRPWPAATVAARLILCLWRANRDTVPGDTPSPGKFLAVYRRSPWSLGYTLLAHGFVGVIYYRFLTIYWDTRRRWLHRVTDPVTRLRFRLSYDSFVIAGMYNLHECLCAVAAYTGRPLPARAHDAISETLLCTYTAVLVLGFHGPVHWLAQCRAYREIRPLWQAIFQVIPGIARWSPRPPCANGLAILAPGSISRLLRGLVYETWDGISTLHPYRSEEVARRARSACRAADLPDDETAIVVEAAVIRAALRAPCGRPTPPTDAFALPPRAGHNILEQADYLERLARAFATSPIVERVTSDQGACSAQLRCPHARGDAG